MPEARLCLHDCLTAVIVKLSQEDQIVGSNCWFAADPV